jgi:hypothetical protein
LQQQRPQQPLRGAGGRIDEIGFAVLRDAAQSEAKLCIPRWAEAINPKSGEKEKDCARTFQSPNTRGSTSGGFVNADGHAVQIKRQDKRAEQIHAFGWT